MSELGTRALRLIKANGKPLVLVGLMGVGKTTVGRRLADAMGLKFVDADEEIEKAAAQPIADIFTNFGELGFRDGEAKVISRLIDQGLMVIATGGGALTTPSTRIHIKNSAISIWLKTDLDILAKRVANKSHRPLLKDNDPLDVLKAQAEARYPFYTEADLCVDTGDNSHAFAVELILKNLISYLDPPLSPNINDTES